MTPIGKLILTRKYDLRLTWKEIAAAGGFSSHSIVHSLARKEVLKALPRQKTMLGIARALKVPYEKVHQAAVASLDGPPVEATSPSLPSQRGTDKTKASPKTRKQRPAEPEPAVAATESSGLLTVKQAAAYLTISQQYLYRLASEHKIAFVRIGTSIRFKRKDLDAWVEEHTVPAVR